MNMQIRKSTPADGPDAMQIRKRTPTGLPDAVQIRKMAPADLPDILQLWNGCVDAGEVLYLPMTQASFHRKFVDGPSCLPENLLVAEAENRVVGFLHGVAPGAASSARPDAAYLTVILVSPACRGKGVGRALLRVFGESMARRGANTLMISGTNPVSLDWRIPGTPGHDHNNMPGADVSCAGYPFLLRCGFTVCAREVALYGDLSAWVPSPDAAAKRERLRAEGIETGPYDPSLEYDFDQMCTNVGSEYWRDVLRTEIAAWKAGQPNADPRFWADGLPPRGPRMLLTAIHKDRIVGFTGPVDRQQSGRGWFTGICTDPAYERRGVATVLFDLLLQAFVREGASFCSLFTGWESHARKIYEKAGLRPVRRFDLLSMPVSPSSAAGTVQGKIG